MPQTGGGGGDIDGGGGGAIGADGGIIEGADAGVLELRRRDHTIKPMAMAIKLMPSTGR